MSKLMTQIYANTLLTNTFGEGMAQEWLLNPSFGIVAVFIYPIGYYSVDRYLKYR